MAKVITPPQIDSLEGLLELVTNPKKGVEYLQSLKYMKDAIEENLALVRTKEAATRLLDEAQATKDQADRLLAQAQADHAQSMQDIQDAHDHLDTKEEAHHQQVANTKLSLDLRAQDLHAYADKLGKEAAHLKEWEAKLLSREQHLTITEQALLLEQQKHAKIKAALSGVA